MNTNTILILDSCCEEEIKFFVLPGDHSDLHGGYINTATDDQKRQDSLCDLLFISAAEQEENKLEGDWKLPFTTEFPVEFMRENPDTKVIVVGFIP